MTLKAQVVRHRSVISCEFPIPILVAASTGHLCTQRQKCDVVQHESRIGAHCRQSVHHRLCVVEISMMAAQHQRLDQGGGSERAPDRVTGFIQAVERGP